MGIRSLICVLIFSFPLSGFAVCEHERAERDHFRDLVNGAATGSNVLAIAGMGLGFLFFGPVGLAVGGVAGGIPAPAGSNWKRILDEKEENLRNCLEAHHRAQQLAEARARDRQAQVIQIQHDFDERRVQIREQCELQLDTIITEYDGFDLSNEDLQGEISQREDEARQERDRALADLACEYERAIAGV